MTIKKADLVVMNGIVLTVDNGNAGFENGGVAIKAGKVIDVGTSGEISEYKAQKTIDARGGIIMPGLVNTHAHSSMTCFRGLADDLPLMTWLNDHIFPAEAKLDKEMVYKGAMLACAEMIMSGTTTFCDMYLFEEAVAEAARKSGMRAVVGEVLYNFPSPNYGELDSGFAYTEKLIGRWSKDPLVSVAVMPHSPYLCSPELLKRAAELSEKHNVPFVIHLSETESEVQQIKETYGLTPVGFLESIGVLSPKTVAAHCVVLTDEDIEILKKNDVKVAHNPESNMKLASGVSPVHKLLQQGLTVGLGTDGCASNNNLDMFTEMDSAAKLHKVNTLDSTVVSAEEVLKMATIEGARTLGLGEITGSIEIGKQADIIVIDTKKPHLTPMYNPVSLLVYSAKGSDVVTSIIGGKVVMEDRKLLTMDLRKVMDDVIAISEIIKEK